MRFLDGVKTILGAAGLVATIVAPRVAPSIAEASPHVVAIAEGVFGTLLAFGVIHKVEKAKSKAGA